MRYEREQLYYAYEFSVTDDSSCVIVSNIIHCNWSFVLDSQQMIVYILQ